MRTAYPGRREAKSRGLPDAENCRDARRITPGTGMKKVDMPGDGDIKVGKE